MKMLLVLSTLAGLAACGQPGPQARFDAAPRDARVPVASPASDTLDTATIPYLSDTQRRQIQADFAQAGNKQRYTLAVSPSGNWAVANNAGMTSAQRGRTALARCAELANEACGLALVDGQRVPFVATPLG